MPTFSMLYILDIHGQWLAEGILCCCFFFFFFFPFFFSFFIGGGGGCKLGNSTFPIVKSIIELCFLVSNFIVKTFFFKTKRPMKIFKTFGFFYVEYKLMVKTNIILKFRHQARISVCLCGVGGLSLSANIWIMEQPPPPPWLFWEHVKYWSVTKKMNADIFFFRMSLPPLPPPPTFSSKWCYIPEISRLIWMDNLLSTQPS